MEASALSNPGPSSPALLGRSPLLRLQSDEKLIALVRRGHPSAFDALVQRYQARLHSFCRHMLGSTEDAEDVLQEVFASAYNAIRADDRPINARAWLYRISRNRALNHMRRPSHTGQDSMDVFERAGGETTADAVHRREDFRLLIADVQALPESQRTALLMREMDALSYEHIAEAMETTVPSVKSLLVRARLGLAEAAEARLLSCDEVRVGLAEAAEGIAKVAPALRRHVSGCERCRVFRTELRRTSRALAAVYPVGPLVVVKKLVWGKLGISSGGGSGAGAGGSGVVGGSTVAGGSAWGGGAVASGSALGGGLLGSAGTGGLLSSGVGAIAAKAAAGLVAAAVVTAGAMEVRHLAQAPPPPA
ncbi:MAG: sigma-70 family RNA polymerase sigma factor, partial [Actinomycetota bacterium]|nr:sigma-70 family RNA polymerase sigma factor [Actinomycetota bacterium]